MPLQNVLRDSRFAIKTVAFDGTAGNGAVGVVNIFTVTGVVELLAIVPHCTENMAGATATISLGIVGNLTLLVAATTATDLVNGEVWVDATPTLEGEAVPAALKNIIIGDGNDIQVDVGTADVTNGTIVFTAYWRPLSADGNLVAA